MFFNIFLNHVFNLDFCIIMFFLIKNDKIEGNSRIKIKKNHFYNEFFHFKSEYNCIVKAYIFNKIPFREKK